MLTTVSGRLVLYITLIVAVYSETQTKGGSHDFSLCSDTDVLGVENIYTKPKNIIPGRTMTFRFSGTTIADIVAPICSVKFESSATTQSSDFDPCTDGGLECPLSAGTPWSMEMKETIPGAANALLGQKVYVTVECRSGNSPDDLVISCAKTRFTVSLRAAEPDLACDDCVENGGAWQLGECSQEGCTIMDVSCYTTEDECEAFYEDQANCEEYCDSETSYCHATEGCIAYGLAGDPCQMTTPPNVQYRCAEELDCIAPTPELMGAPGICTAATNLSLQESKPTLKAALHDAQVYYIAGGGFVVGLMLALIGRQIVPLCQRKRQLTSSDSLSSILDDLELEEQLI